MRLKIAPFAAVAAALGIACCSASAMVINLVPNASLSGNTPALNAFQRAADQWTTRLNDPITLTIDAELDVLGAGILGSTSNVLLQGGFNTVRNAMATDALDEGVDDAVLAFLPTAATFLASVPSGKSLNANMVFSKANGKALGFSGLDAMFGASDATVTFSSTFGFDFDNSDGVSPGLIDFESVASHEIGHVLGFISAVDEVNTSTTSIKVEPLDLFRFRNGSVNDPTTFADFAIAARDLVPGRADVFDDTTNEYGVSTGLNGIYAGTDNRQASHWKDDALTGLNIGIMDPTISSGVTGLISAADLRAMDLIGYEIVTLPEPAVVGTLDGSLTTFFRRRRA